MASPLEQFKIEPLIELPRLGNYDVSFTNSALWMTVAVAVVAIFMVASVRRQALIPGRWQSMAELSYEFVANMLRENVGSAGMRFFPFVFTLFMFILVGNMLSMLPYSFAFTSHIIVTFGLALVVFIGVTLVGFIRHGHHFLGFFVPKGVPALLLPLMIPIEILSYLTRPVSLVETASGYAVIDGKRSSEIVSNWQLDEVLFSGRIDGRLVTVQVERDGIGYRMSYAGAQMKVLVLLPRAAELAGHMLEKTPPDMSKYLLSPMPGLLVSLAVQEGQEVKAGQELAVVEAMKMENLLRAERDGKVVSLHAKTGDSLAVDQIIIEFAG